MVALYLHEQGRSNRYIAKKLELSHKTVGRWIADKQHIVDEDKERLARRLFEMVLVERDINWYE